MIVDNYMHMESDYLRPNDDKEYNIKEGRNAQFNLKIINTMNPVDMNKNVIRCVRPATNVHK